MYKNTASQKIALFAFDTTTGLPKTGDAANITAYVNKDWAGVVQLGDTSATEIDNTNAKGWYLWDLTQAETNADALLFSGKSTTANITVVGQLVYTGFNVGQINADATSAANLAKTTRFPRATVGSSSSTTSVTTSAIVPAITYAADQLKGRRLIFDADTTTTSLREQATKITANTNSATPTFTVDALTTAPASGDTFSIV